MPSWLDRVEVAGLPVAGASTGSHVTLADASVHGDLEVVLQIVETIAFLARPAG